MTYVSASGKNTYGTTVVMRNYNEVRMLIDSKRPFITSSRTLRGFPLEKGEDGRPFDIGSLFCEIRQHLESRGETWSNLDPEFKQAFLGRTGTISYLIMSYWWTPVAYVVNYHKAGTVSGMYVMDTPGLSQSSRKHAKYIAELYDGLLAGKSK